MHKTHVNCRRYAPALVLSILTATLWAPAARAQSTNIITGSITVPGEQDRYVFNLPTNAIFYLDVLTNVADVHWTLTGPPGLVASRGFTQTDGQSIGDPLLRLPAGDYSLTVDCTAGQVSGYAFRFVDLASATLIVPGTVVSGSLSPANETDFFQFTAAPGDRFVFDQISRVNLPNCYWTLIDPYGGILFHDNFADVGTVASPVTLRAGGTYTLMIEGYYANTGSGTYSFNVAPQGNTPPVPFTGTPLAIGDLIVSNAPPNTTHSFIFTLPDRKVLAFDSQTNTPNLTWTLEGPPGIVVDQRGFNSSDGPNFAGSPLDLPAGDYQLRVRGTVANPYRFRLLDLSAATAVTPGTPVAGSLSPANETDLYRFNASAGSAFYFDAISANTMPNAQWKLVNPYGGVLFHQGVTADGARRTLTAAGTYTLSVEGYHSDTGAGTYSFNIVPVSDGSQTLTLGNVVNGAITSPGQLQRYTFDIATSARLYFDALTNVALRWSLTGPTGTLVNNRTFTSSDGINISDPLVRVSPGAYTLTISGNGDDIGNYQFRLFDVATAAPMTPGTPVSGTLNPARETDAYAFTLATPGEYYFNGQAVSGLPNARQRLIDANGAFYIDNGLGTDTGPINLRAGSYLLLVEGYHNDIGNGTYALNLAPTSDSTQPGTTGDIIAGNIAAPGQTHDYTFTLSDPKVLCFDVLTNSPHRWSLRGPTGTLINNRGFTASDAQNVSTPLLDLPPGNYTLSISMAGDDTGAYGFRLLDTSATPNGDATPMTPGVNVSGTLSPATQTHIYTFSLAAPGEYFFDGRTVTGLPNARQRVVDSHGNFYVNTGLGTDTGPFILPAGDYLVLIEGYYGEVGNGSYTFNLMPVADVTQPMTLGDLVSGAITGPGQRQAYTFSIPAGGATVCFDSHTNSTLRWSLSGPTGLLVNNRGFNASDAQNITTPLLFLSPGNYTLSVSGADDTTGGYRFRLFDTATATPMIPGTPVTANLNPANETEAYAFTLGTPTRLYLNGQSVSGLPNARQRLVDAYGNFYVNNGINSDTGPFTLPAGDYLVLIEGYHSEVGNGSYTFNLARVNNATQPVTIGSTTSGNITFPGQDQVYTFTIASPEGARLYFDSLANNGSLVWSLSGPTGAIVNNRAFSTSDAQSVGNPILPLPAGDYRLTVSGSGDTTGAYEFRLLDFATATPLTPGTPVTVNNFPANTTHLYTFTAAPGDRFFFDHQANTGLPNVYWRLVDPYNAIIFARNLNSDAGTNVLGPAGIYTLLVEGYIGDTSQGSYAFNVRPEGNVPPPAFTGTPLTIGTVVGGTLASSTATNAYTFSLPATTRLCFDALTNAAFRWTLRGPPGLIVNNRDFTTSDGYDGNPLLNLPAGDYELTITGLAGSYQFRLLDFANAAVYTPGTLVTNSLAPGRSTALFRFTGTAGDRMFFDGRPNSGLSQQVQARLYAPAGNLLLDQSITDDAQTFTLLQSGTYTLAIEGRISENSASGTGSFNLQPVTHSTNALTIGATTSGTIGTVGQIQYYTFTVPSDARLYFDALVNNDFYWRLDAPRGEVVPWRAFPSSDAAEISNPIVSLDAGTYTLGIAAQNFSFTGSYQFRVLDLGTGTAYTPGTSVTNTLAPARGTTLYRFTGAAGQRVFFDGRPVSGFSHTPYARIIAPLGNIIMAESVNTDVQTFTLPQSGDYTIAVEGRIYDNNASGTYAFNLQPVMHVTNALTLGALNAGAITTVGQIHYYTFSLPSAARLYFDALTYEDFYWRLEAQWGEVIPWRSFNSSDAAEFANPMLSLEPGNYTLAVAVNSFASTGSYQFRLLDFEDAIAFTPGTVVSNALAPNRSTVFYEFVANAGDKMYFDGRPTAGFSHQPETRIYAPLGNIVMDASVNSDVGTFTLPQSGTYKLTVEGRIYDNGVTGNYAFNLQPVTYPTNALTIGATTGGTISTLGQAHYYTFSLAAPAWLYFDALINQDFYWRIDAQAGAPNVWRQVVDWRGFGSSDASEVGNPLLSLDAGSYVLAVAANNFSFTGGYEFRLLDFASASPITPGTLVNGTLAPNRSSTFYRFNASAGDRFYFDGRPSSGFSHQPYVRLYAPLGNVVLEQSVNSDIDTFSVPQSGNYVVTVEGRIYDVGTNGAYAFNFVPNPLQPQEPLFNTNNSPDLIVSAVSVSPSSGLQSGDTMTVHWTVQNTGNVATAGSFTDRITVRKTATSQIIINSTLAYNETDPVNGPIAPGQTRARELNIRLPDGTNGIGNLEVTVTTDALNNIVELNSGATGEANNSASTTITPTLAPYPDLLVHSVTATPATGWLPGSLVTIAWRLTNAGPRAASTSWVDSVVIRNTNTAYIFSTTTNYVLSEAGNGPLAPNDVRDRSISFTVPNNANAYGGFEITITTDSTSQVFEFNGAGTAETNNTRSTIVRTAPDLRIVGLTVTGSPELRSGANLTVSWNTTNEGTVETGGQFSDRVVIRNDTTSEVLLDTSVAYNPATAGNGPIAPGESRPRSRSFLLPEGPRGAGQIEVTVTADTSNQLLELNASGTGEANNATSTTVTSALTPDPDLQISRLVVPPTGSVGQPISIIYSVTNSGPGTAAADWVDRLYLSSDATFDAGDTFLTAFSAATISPLASSGVYSVTQSVVLPNNSVGTSHILVVTDALQNQREVDDSNNVAGAVIQVDAPDLQIANLTVTPPSLASGTTLLVQWNDTNSGVGAARRSWYDRVLIQNTTRGQTLLDTVLYYDVNVNGILASGQSIPRQHSFRLPDGTNGAGDIRVTIHADYQGNLFEHNAAGQGESNNVAVLTRTSTLGTYADLTVSNIVVPASGLPGQQVDVLWTIHNEGNAIASAPWSEHVFLSDDAVVGADQFIASLSVNTDLAIGASVTRTQRVTLPSHGTGNKFFIVRADAGNNVFELNETNNTRVDSEALNIPSSLTLTFNSQSFSEATGTNVIQGTVSRNTDTASQITVTLSSGNTNAATVPPTVIILAGRNSATFFVTPVDDALVDGPQTAVISASASGFSPVSSPLTVTDNDTRTLTLQLGATTVAENAGAGALLGYLTRNANTNEPLIVSLRTDDPTKLRVTNVLTIAPGERAASFVVDAVDNDFIDGTRHLNVFASATNYNAVSAALDVIDDDNVALSLAIADASIAEGAPTPATIGTVSRSPVTSRSLTISLGAAPSSDLSVPVRVTIPADQAAVSFNINARDDGFVNGTRTATLTARPVTDFGVVIETNTASANIEIRDNDGPTLTVAIDTAILAEGDTAIGTVTRNTATSAPLTVALVSSAPDEAQVPPSVTIPAGQASTTFAVNGQADSTSDGLQPVTITATSAGFNSGSANVTVSDIDLPDLRVSSLTVPTNGVTDGRVTVVWTVVNNGITPAASGWSDRILISSDNQLGGDTLLSTINFTGSLEVGQSYTRTQQVLLPSSPGQFWIIAETDAGGNVVEGSERNNALAHNLPLTIAPSYRASVETDVINAPNGTPIPLRGRATNTVDGSPARFRLLTLRIHTAGTRRTLSVVANANGEFNALFQPLPNEAGLYSVGADHPLVLQDADQDYFTILGMRANPEAVNLRVVPNETVTGQIEIHNRSEIPMAGLTAVGQNVHSNLNVQLSLSNQLAGSSSIFLNYSIRADYLQQATFNFNIHVQSGEGAMLDIPVSVAVVPLRPQLIANPSFLERGMLRGAQTIVAFDVANRGGAPSGPLNVLLPDVPWMSLLSATNIPSIPPGTNVTVTLALNPATNLALQRYDGAVVLSGAQSGLNVPFQFRALSDAVGDLRVAVQDEYTFFVAEGPKVTNATVRVRDAINGELVAEGSTGDSGEVLLTNIPEGAYSLEVTADRHAQFRGTVTIVPAVTTTTEAFISRQTVTYRWSVVPIEIEDRYRIVLESVFETEVPIPNVVVETPFIMPLVVVGQTTQFDVKLRNEGLIAANGVRLNVPNDPNYIITPLVDEIGVLPAKTSVTIPVTIRHRATPAPGLARALNHGGTATAAGGGGGCEVEVAPCLPKIPINATYYYVCGPNNVLQARQIDVSPVCTAISTYECLEAIRGAGEAAAEAGNLAAASCEIIEAILQCAGAELSECQSAALQIACRTVVGGATGGIAGAAGGAASGLSDSLGCLCELLSEHLNLSLTPAPAMSTGGGFGGWTVNFAPYASGFGGGGGGGGGNTCNSGSSLPMRTAAFGAGKVAATTTSPAGVCARVRIRIEQEAVMTRAAFLGSLEIDNEGGSALSGVRVDLDFRDANGNSVSDRFAIRGPQLTGLSDVAGGGTIASGASGSAKYTFIPTHEAAPTAPAVYRIGGTLRYIENGVEVLAPLLSSTITVYPEARMQLTYFQQRDVFSDDPFTDIVEPAEPFSLGLIAKNVGAGAAKNFRITSAQPEIIENQKGLLIDFKIIGTKVGAQELSPSLTANLGNIPPGGAQVAQWSFLSSLQGKFIDYSATFEHLDSLGGANLSLIENVSIHELIHPVRADRAGDDVVPDFLVNDEPDPDNLPDRLYLSDGSQAIVNLSANPQTDGPVTLGDFQVTLTAFMSSGWNYFRLPDPGPGFRLHRVARSDGRELRVGDNVWTTDRTFPASQAGARREHTLHLLDFNGTGSYTLYYRLEDSIAPMVLDVIDLVPELQTAPVASIDVVLSEQIDLATFTHQDVTLTLNGGPNLITSAVTVSFLSNATYRISGLAPLTAADGNYELTVFGAGIRDYGDNSGTNIVSESWAKGAIAPVVVSVGPVTPDPRGGAVSSIDVAFSRPINPATFTTDDLALTRDGSAVPLSSVIITTLSSNTFRLSGLDAITSAEGTYALTVRALQVEDTDANPGLGALTDSWVTDSARPVITAIEQIATDPRNIAVQTLDVTFSEPIDPATFDWRDVSLTRNGGPNLITSVVGVSRLDALHYRISNFNWVVGLEGTYTLSVNAAAITDLAGNTGIGLASESWVMDTTRPAAPSNLAISPDRGISANDGLSNTNAALFTGTLGETNLNVRLFDLTAGADLGDALVTGATFSKLLNLTAVGAHRIRVRAADSAANVTDAFFNIFIDVERPEIALQPVVPNPRTNGVTSLDVTFSEPINPAMFRVAGLSLTRDGGTNLVTTNVVSIQMLTSNVFRINGLQSLTAPLGLYELVVNASAVEDLAGNAALLSATNTWQRALPNTAPRLSVPPTRTINEGSLLSFIVLAMDTDDPTNTLVFSLAPGAPLGAAIDPLTGEFTWTPSEAQGPQLVAVNIRCTDDGTPNLTTSTNVTITVNEVNASPVLAAVPNQFTFIDTQVAVTNIATDPDIPANALTFHVGPGAPEGLRIDAGSGVLTWRPGSDFAGTTNPVTVIVTDNGVPSMSRSNTFLIIVGDHLQVVLGRGVMQIGKTSSVPVSVEASSAVTNVSFLVRVPSARLTNPALQGVLPGLTAALTPAGPDRVQLVLSRATALPSGQTLANLSLVAPSNQPSAIVPLLVSEPQAMQANGVPVPRVSARDGRMVIVGAEPLLEALIGTNAQRALVLYGRSNVTYDVESATNLNPVVIWTPYWRGGVTNLIQQITPQTDRMLFYRAR